MKWQKYHNNLPHALVIGPQKAGTTWIHQYLQARGDICLPSGVKETFFFDRFFSRGAGWYAKHFECSGKHVLTIEVAPTYFQSRDTRERIISTLGRVPLIVTLRDPVKRCFSLFLHMRRYGMTKDADFREALDHHPELIDSSLYATHLLTWFDHFGKERVLVLIQEDLEKDHNHFVKKLTMHLGIEFFPVPKELMNRVNVATAAPSIWLASFGQKWADRFRYAGMYKVVKAAKYVGLKRLFFGSPGSRELPSLNDEDRRFLMDKLQAEIKRLEQILELDLSVWKNP